MAMNKFCAIVLSIASCLVFFGCSNSVERIGGAWSGKMEISGRTAENSGSSDEEAGDVFGDTAHRMLHLQFITPDSLTISIEADGKQHAAQYGYSVLERTTDQARLRLTSETHGNHELQLRFIDDVTMVVRQVNGNPRLIPVEMKRKVIDDADG